jgi:hypothetical protein
MKMSEDIGRRLWSAIEIAAGRSRNPPSRIVADGTQRVEMREGWPRVRCGRTGAWNAAHRRAAESTKVDFVTL